MTTKISIIYTFLLCTLSTFTSPRSILSTVSSFPTLSASSITSAATGSSSPLSSFSLILSTATSFNSDDAPGLLLLFSSLLASVPSTTAALTASSFNSDDAPGLLLLFFFTFSIGSFHNCSLNSIILCLLCNLLHNLIPAMSLTNTSRNTSDHSFISGEPTTSSHSRDMEEVEHEATGQEEVEGQDDGHDDDS